MSSQQRSLPSVASGLRLWHQFAVQHLRYSAEATLPPRSTSDVLHLVALFKNPGTATNYVSYVRWACALSQLSMERFGGQVQMALKGLKKQREESLTGHLRVSTLLTEDRVAQLVSLCNGLPKHEQVGDVVLLAWRFQCNGARKTMCITCLKEGIRLYECRAQGRCSCGFDGGK